MDVQVWLKVSIPSRGFWFFEGAGEGGSMSDIVAFQSPRGDFGFLKVVVAVGDVHCTAHQCFNPLAGILVF